MRIVVSDHADTDLFTDLDNAVQNLLRVGVMPVLSYEPASDLRDMTDPAQRQAFLDWWGAVANHYRFYSHNIGFDLISKVQQMTFADAADANGLYADTTTAVQSVLGSRILLFAPYDGGKPADLDDIVVPAAANGRALVKWQFWHNGPRNEAGSGTSWTTGTTEEREQVTAQVVSAETFQNTTGIPVYHSPWRSYDGGDTFTQGQQQKFSRFLIGELENYGYQAWSVQQLQDYLDPDTLSWSSTNLVDEFVNGAVDVVINEVMIRPNAVAETAGEWIELHNLEAEPIDLQGWLLRSENGSRAIVEHEITSSVVISPGGFAVLCVNSDSALNGGVLCDYAYASDLVLANANGSLVVVNDGSETVDRLVWETAATGASLCVVSAETDNNTPNNQLTSQMPFGAGDNGTPGAANPDCAIPTAVHLLAPTTQHYGFAPVILFGMLLLTLTGLRGLRR